MDEEPEIDVCIISTINGRILIGEIVNAFSSGIELRNVFLIDHQHPEGMVPLHKDSVMADTRQFIRNNIIETESQVSEDLRNQYISFCLKELIIRMQLKEDQSNETFFGSSLTDPSPFDETSKKQNNLNQDDSLEPPFKWRDRYNNN